MLSTGSDVLNNFLNGGFKEGEVSVIYGPATSGKTTTALMTALNSEKKVMFLDTEGGFSSARLKQLNKDADIKNIFVLRINSFEEQEKTIAAIHKQCPHQIGLIICDTISVLFRKERTKDNTLINNSLKKQAKMLEEIAKKNNIPVLLTSQVFADVSKQNKVHIVGGELIKPFCKVIIEFQIVHSNVRKALYKDNTVLFRIEEKGFTRL